MAKFSTLALLILAVLAISVVRTRLTPITEIKSTSEAESCLGTRQRRINNQDNVNTVIPDPNAYDTLVLATEWSGSVCSLRKCNQGRPVCNSAFNLHGLWPNVREDYRKSPFDCKSTTISIPSLPQDLQNALKYYWNSLYSPASDFLNHEWQKHGSCWNPQAVSIPEVPSDIKPLIIDTLDALTSEIKHQSSYIKVAIALSQKYNVFKALASRGILPNNERILTKDEILDALENAFGVRNYQILCSKDRTGSSFLTEVRMCLDKNYNPVECYSLQFNCANTMIFPTYA